VKPLSTLACLTVLLFPMSFIQAEKSPQIRKPPPPAEVIAKLPPDGGEEFNRLVFEKSPYLLQHARNPVDWYPWSEEAFAKAKKENKPILLSVGYTTCHWCHVMEHESFEDEGVAQLMNDWFVPVKVDREERPDIDEVYMTVTQAMTGSGGWPMTVVMGADKKPFFAGTYFPKEDRLGRPGFKSVLKMIHDVWTNDPGKVEEVSGNISGALKEMVQGNPGEALDSGTLDKAYQELKARYDAEYGGFGKAPKFPTPPVLTFLLRYWKRTGEAEALMMVEKTLLAMRNGGVYDQIGFGTHRYSTDREWLVPHFEKMLYDQALLAIANLEAYQATEKQVFADVAREIFTYVLRDMTAPEGGFYSAEDADSEGEEGVFYVWTPAEIIKVLGKEDGELFNKVFEIEEGGNYLDEVIRQKNGTSIPHRHGSLSETAATFKMDVDELEKKLETARGRLFAHREKRVHPQKDDKILTDWNGLMIAALAKGGQVLGDPRYSQAAAKAADFVLTVLRDKEGKLVKRYRSGSAGLTAHLEDYAFVVWGLIDLYEATFETRYLQQAITLNDTMLEQFWDTEKGGFFMTATDSEKLLTRVKKIYGGAIPSGNAVAALNLLRLSRMTGKTYYEEKQQEIIRAFSGDVAKSPSGFPMLLHSVDFAVGPSYEVVVAGKEIRTDDVQSMLHALRKPFIPNKIVLFRADGDLSTISQIASYTAGQKSLDGKATAYVCRDFACSLPTRDLGKMIKNLSPGTVKTDK